MDRRKFLTVLGGISGLCLAAPPIVRATSLMPIKMAPEDKLLVRAWEHIHPASFGVPRQWVHANGLVVQGMPKAVWTWETFLKETSKANQYDVSPLLRFADVRLHDFVFDAGLDVATPKWVGVMEYPYDPHLPRRRG